MGAQLGNLDRGASARYGGALGDNGTFRVYALGFERGDSALPDGDGDGADDAWDGWQVSDSFELSVAGFNLLDDQHPEAGEAATRKTVHRSVYVGARWSF